MTPSLSASGLALALRLLEAHHLEITHDALVEGFGDTGAELVEKRFWLKVQTANPPTHLDDNGYPVNVDWDVNRREFGYYSATEGWTTVNSDRLSYYRPDLERLIGNLLDRRTIKLAGGIFTVDDSGFAWEIGALRLTQKGMTTVWFIRCLNNPGAVEKIRDAATAMPSGKLRLFLTSSDRAAAQSLRVPSATIVSIADVLSRNEHPQIDMAVLKARFTRSTAEPITEPVHLSGDGRVLTLLGDIEIRFRGSKQIAGIRYIVAEIRKGKRVRAADVLRAADSDAGQLDKLFRSQWPALRKYFQSQSGLWGFEL